MRHDDKPQAAERMLAWAWLGVCVVGCVCECVHVRMCRGVGVCPQHRHSHCEERDHPSLNAPHAACRR